MIVEHPKPVHPRFIDLTGKAFGRLTVVAFAGRGKWHVRCECGQVGMKSGLDLRSGDSKSCGCLKREQLGDRRRTHGKCKTPEYRSWSHMIGRCENPTDKKFPIYGGRGITVCARWRESFETFLEDMGQRPSKRHSLDRINVNGDYEPDNCRWATAKEQSRNTRTNRPLTFNGETRLTVEWAELLGVEPYIINWRLANGWTVERALSTPPQNRKAS